MDNESMTSDISHFKKSLTTVDDLKHSYRKKKLKNLEKTADITTYQTMINVRNENIGNHNPNVAGIQILSDGETWIENTTAITENTSERSESIKEVDQWIIGDKSFTFTWQNYIGSIICVVTVTFAFLSPLIMTIFPRIGLFLNAFSALTFEYKLMHSTCDIECKGHLLALIFKSTLLGVGCWAIFIKKRKVGLPRIFMFRMGIIILTSLCTCTYWLFYIMQLVEGNNNIIVKEYRSLVIYAENLSDTLLFIHYTGVLLIEIRHLTPKYYLKVVRSPDGASKSYAVGSLSIQRTAVWILDKYYTEFPIYNPFLEKLPATRSGKKQHSNAFKFYEVDRNISKNIELYKVDHEKDLAPSTLQGRRKDSNHNERFYEEYEYDRRVRKRKARLLTATEEAFSHIRRINSETRLITNQTIFDPIEAAQSVFPSMSRSLQKYLRITRQQPRHSVESILKRLAQCLALDSTPITFLEPFFNDSPVLSNEKERCQNLQHWALICEGQLPSRHLSHGCEFQLRQGEVSLLCSIHKLPHVYLSEQMAVPKSNRFILKLNSEDSI